MKLWTWLKRRCTSPVTLDVLISRYDWPKTPWSPGIGAEPPSVEAVAAVIAPGRLPVQIRTRLIRRYRWELWALIDAREAELPVLEQALCGVDWGPAPEYPVTWDADGIVGTVESPELTAVDIARVIVDPLMTEAVRRRLLRAWGYRLGQAHAERRRYS